MTPLNRRPIPPHSVCALLTALGWCLSTVLPAGAQEPALRSSPRLQESPSTEESRAGAVHVSGEHITVRPDMDLRIDGQAELRRPGLVIGADRMAYDQTEDRVRAEGQVHVNRQGNAFQGPRVELQVDSFSGRFESPKYRLLQGGHGDARDMVFIDQDRSAIHQARYTTCRATPGPEWLPEWFLQASTIHTDAVDQTGTAEGVQLHFKGLSTPTLPGFSFGLSSNRQSGLLSPVIGVDSINGIDIQQPYYWNIAPNRDATLTTRLMSKRGAAVEGDFRYLESDYQGQARLNWMPSDTLRQSPRWGLSAQHTGLVDAGMTSPLGLALSLNRVSDDNYWRDFPRSGTASNIALTQRLLPSNAALSWSQDQLSMQMRVQKWQTLQDVTSGSYIKPPYDKEPQLTLRYADWQTSGPNWSVTADTTRFVADYGRLPSTYGSPTNGNRSYVQAQVGQNWSRPWGFITPKIQLHATRYDMQSALNDGSTSVNRVLPTFSLDSGLTFERDTQWFGRSLTQTLEPRLFYVRTPYRDQSMLPLYDTGLADFSLATIYSDNPYVGQDRIVDNDALTVGLNSRFFDSTTGSELLRLGLAQRVRFSDQRVNLSSTANTVAAGDGKGLSDLLLGASTRWTDTLSLDGAIQLNADTHEVRRSTLQTRYNPGPYRLLNAAYRLNKDSTSPSELIDIGWQWPLSDLRWAGRPDDSEAKTGGQGLGVDRWYGVGRLNYSLEDRRLVDTLVGFEYDAGCWLGRVVFERLQSTATTANTRLMFQLELVGFGRVGVSPLDSLKRNIPRYQYLRENPTTPSRFLQYE